MCKGLRQGDRGKGMEAGGVRQRGQKRVDGSVDGRGRTWERGQQRKEDEGVAEGARAVRGESSRERRGDDSMAGA